MCFRCGSATFVVSIPPAMRHALENVGPGAIPSPWPVAGLDVAVLGRDELA